jgi:glyoxylase-like metal-dependent hydrolase (beta-lactamase superfamily II)
MPADAIKWREEVAKHGRVRYLINTEPHGDHFTGNFFFEGTVVAHEGTRQAILAASVEQLKERFKQMEPQSLPLLEGYTYRPPTITLSQRLTIYVGKHTFQLINLPGHTPSDNVFGKVQAWLHQALPYEWLDSLKKMQDLDADVLVPGHGSVSPKSYLTEMGAFIQAWIDAVKAAIKKGMSLEEAQNKVSLLDRYPMQAGSEPMAQMVQQMNIARLYEVLKK